MSVTEFYWGMAIVEAILIGGLVYGYLREQRYRKGKK